MNTDTIQKGDLCFLLHPGEAQFSGYGLALTEGSVSPLVGLLMIDRPDPASAQWIKDVVTRFGGYEFVPMTRSGERGIACQMWIAQASQIHVRPLAGDAFTALQAALLPLLTLLPVPQFDLGWDSDARRWRSQFHEKSAVQNDSDRPKQGRPRFALGQVVATPGALAALEEAGQIPQEFLHRHLRGDWGELDPHDMQANERALEEGDRLFSAYTTTAGVRLWLITEYDRSVTTLLLPSEY